ncbi:MAG: hypothetical protein KDD66_05160 [Bdellovibrionales bacterium]|nr:hypothetical protein [Bdellovibrionales bacterium]
MFLYFIWALLPFAFFILTIKSSYRRARGTLAQSETPVDQLSQFIFTLIAFGVAVLITEYGLDSIMDLLASFGFQLEEGVVSWLIYPVILLGGAMVNEFIKPKKKAVRTMPGSRYVRP